MLYPYIELPDETIIIHSGVLENNSVLTNFRQPYDDGFREARIELPSYRWLYSGGFSNEQIKSLVQLTRKNAVVIYKYTRLGGIDNA